MPVKLDSLQALRALAALMVLAAHLTQHEMRFLGGLTPLWTSAGVSGVDLFFVLSGFVMVFVTRHAPHGELQFTARFLYARATRIYPPYWAATLAVLVGYKLLESTLATRIDDLQILSAFLLWPEREPPILLVGWTLIHELYFYLVFAALLLAPRKALPALLLAWVGGITLAGLTVGPDAAPVITLVTHPLTAEFVLGCGAGLLVTSGRRSFAIAAMGLAVVWWIAVTAGISWTGHESMPTGWWRVAAFGVPAALLVYAVACREIDHGVRTPRSLKAIGDWSFALYLVHLPIVTVLARVWPLAIDDSALSSLAYIVTGSLISLAAAAAMHHLFEKPALALTRKAGDRMLPAARPIADTPREATRIW